MDGLNLRKNSIFHSLATTTHMFNKATCTIFPLVSETRKVPLKKKSLKILMRHVSHCDKSVL